MHQIELANSHIATIHDDDNDDHDDDHDDNDDDNDNWSEKSHDAQFPQRLSSCLPQQSRVECWWLLRQSISGIPEVHTARITDAATIHDVDDGYKLANKQ